MATITIELDETTAGLFEVQGIVQGLRSVLDLLPHQHTVNFRMEDDDPEPTEDPPLDPEPSYVVQVNDRYTYISDVYPRVKPGDEVDIESQNGGHWQGEVTEVFEVDDYNEDHPLPTLRILGLF